MTRTTPFLLIILHLSHIFFTEDLTFIFPPHQGDLTGISVLLEYPYLYRYMIRPLVKSYGDSSIVTLSPGKIFIKCILILPEIWAKTLCPFSNFTLKVALGRVSTIVPSTLIGSSFAIEFYLLKGKESTYRSSIP